MLTTIKRSLLSDFQHRSESKIKIAWSQLSHHWLCILFQVQGCLLRLKMANTLRRINSSSSGSDLWVVLFSNRDPSQPFTAHSDAASKCSLSLKASAAAVHPSALSRSQVPTSFCYLLSTESIARRREVPLLMILSQDCFMSYQS